MAMSDASQQTIPDPKDFGLKEFEIVRNEHDALDARLITIIQYILLLSAVIYPFLLGHKPSTLAERVAYAIVWIVPTIATVTGGLILLGIEQKIRTIDDYLHCVEKRIKVSGWEHFRRSVPACPRLQVKYLLPKIVIGLILLNIIAFGLGIWYNFTVPIPDAECGV